MNGNYPRQITPARMGQARICKVRKASENRRILAAAFDVAACGPDFAGSSDVPGYLLSIKTPLKKAKRYMSFFSLLRDMRADDPTTS